MEFDEGDPLCSIKEDKNGQRHAFSVSVVSLREREQESKFF